MLFPCLIFQVEALVVENKDAYEQISRWREACEMEVAAGKKAIKEHEELVGSHDLSSFLIFTCFVSALTLSQVVARFYFWWSTSNVKH